MTQITSSDVKWYLSTPLSAPGYSGPSSAGASLGGYMSTTQISTTPLNDLFPDITGPENAAGQVDYQCLFLMNATASGNTMRGVTIWLQPLPPEAIVATSIAVAVDPVGNVLYNSTDIQAAIISSPTTEPAEVMEWFGPTEHFYLADVNLTLPDIPPNYCTALWLQRTALNSVAITGDSHQVQCIFSTHS